MGKYKVKLIKICKDYCLDIDTRSSANYCIGEQN